MNPKISVISPSIREKGLKVVEETLKHQTFKDFEWLPKLSVPGPVPDLCRSFNECIKKASGELLVFLEDYTVIPPDGLEHFWNRYQSDPDVGWTAPLGKVNDLNDPQPVKWDWRIERENGGWISWNEFEIDWACLPKRAMIEVGGFDEDYDSGFSWENCDLGYRLFKLGWGFRVDTKNRAIAWDHDAHIPHPYRHKPNLDLWTGKKREIDQGKVKLGFLSS